MPLASSLPAEVTGPLTFFPRGENCEGWRWPTFLDLEAEIQQDVATRVRQSRFLNLKEIYTASDSPSFDPRSNHDVYGPHAARSGIPPIRGLSVNPNLQWRIRGQSVPGDMKRSIWPAM